MNQIKDTFFHNERYYLHNDKFLKFVINNSLIQHVCSSIRKNNILDLGLYNDSHVLHDLCEHRR